MRIGFFVVVCAWAGCSSTEKLAAIDPGELIGQVEISQDVPASSCLVLLEGTPLAGKCDESGAFDIRHVPPGRWDLRIIIDDAATALPAKRLAAAANSGQVSDLGAIRLAQPGSVGGHLVNTSGTDLSLSVVAVPEVGAVTAPNSNNGYLLDKVAPGLHEIVLITDAGTVIRKNVVVSPGKVTIGADLDLANLQANTVAVSGHAGRAEQPGNASGITVELVESRNGAVMDHTATNGDGSFELKAKPGTYVIRAHDGSNPVTAIVPSVVVKGSGDLTLTSTLTIHDKAGDLDSDGVPNDKDLDIDGDGVPNDQDAFPYDPAEWLDSDGDGLGDRSDLRSMGGPGIDHQNATPDSDGDGKLDFEDNCPKLANADQKDSDSDGVGDVCDNCKFVANSDQTDSVMNGTGDACRSCKQNADCPGGKLCNFGQCISCINNQTCGDQVCDLSTGICGPCQLASDCTVPDRCDPFGRCVACLGNSDCAPGLTCVVGQCRPQCVNGSDCPGQFCVNGACALCRGNADCPGSEWCDSGQCKPQCTTDGDCTGGRTCVQATRTCVLPCMVTCMDGKTCTGGFCRDVCDGTHLCPSGFKCATGACLPECAVDADCASVRPFTNCRAGACVSDGGCGFDADCDSTSLCISGTCAARSGALIAGKGYKCTQPCDCKQGEVCALNADLNHYCVADHAPNWFVSQAGGCSGACDGSTPLAFSNNLVSVMNKVKSGDGVAVRGGDSFGPQSIKLAGVSLLGGFVVCAPNRWVRDTSARSTLTNTVDVLTIPGSAPSPIPDVTVAGFALVQTSPPPANTTFHGVIATHTDNLTLANLSAAMVLPPPGDASIHPTVAGFTVTNADNVNLSDLDMVGVTGCGDCDAYALTLNSISGIVRNIQVGGLIAGTTRVADINDTAGPITVDSLRSDGGSGGKGDRGIQVTNGAAGLVTIKNCQVSWQATLLPGVGSSTWHGISTINSPNIAILDNIVDGRGVVETVGGTWTTREGFYFQNSDGVVTGNTVYFPTTSNLTSVYGYRVLGPDGRITFTSDSSSLGNQAGVMVLASVESVSVGPVIFSKDNFSAVTVVGNSYGFNIANSSAAVLISDTTVSGGSNNLAGSYAYAAAITSSAVKIERSKIMPIGHAVSYGIYATSSSVELYDSYVAAGPNNTNPADAVFLNASQLFAVNNTLDGGGSTSNGGYSAGVEAEPTALLFMTNNLISAGQCADHRRVFSSTGSPSPALVAANWHNNYFWTPALGADSSNEDVGFVATAPSPSPDPRGNRVMGNNSCYDPAFAQPDYHILDGSLCVNGGIASLRQDGTPISIDIDGNVRAQGAAVDIGAHELK